METPRDRARAECATLELETTTDRFSLLRMIIEEMRIGVPIPRIDEVNGIIISHVNPHMEDYLEKYSSWPLSNEDKKNIYIGYYVRVSRHFFNWFGRVQS